MNHKLVALTTIYLSCIGLTLQTNNLSGIKIEIGGEPIVLDLLKEGGKK